MMKHFLVQSRPHAAVAVKLFRKNLLHILPKDRIDSILICVPGVAIIHPLNSFVQIITQLIIISQKKHSGFDI
jgi:hypothetical protein